MSSIRLFYVDLGLPSKTNCISTKSSLEIAVEKLNLRGRCEPERGPSAARCGARCARNGQSWEGCKEPLAFEGLGGWTIFSGLGRRCCGRFNQGSRSRRRRPSDLRSGAPRVNVQQDAQGLWKFRERSCAFNGISEMPHWAPSGLANSLS